MLGYNFLLYELCLIPFEISALNLVLTFWRSDIPIWATSLACTVLYGILNITAVRWYGESEFWLASGKVLLIGIVFMFTFITSEYSKVLKRCLNSNLIQWSAVILNTMPTASDTGVNQEVLQPMSLRAVWVAFKDFSVPYSKPPSPSSVLNICLWSLARQ